MVIFKIFNSDPNEILNTLALKDEMPTTSTCKNSTNDISPVSTNSTVLCKEVNYGSGDTNLKTGNYNVSEKKIETEQTENKLLEQLESERAIAKKTNDVIYEFEDILQHVLKDRDKLDHHKNLALKHLANIEFAFHDLTTKYERSKSIVHQYQENETILIKTLKDAESLLNYREEKYQALKSHANEKLQEANLELDRLQKQHSMEMAKLRAMVKISECKVESLQQQLDQKSAENIQMTRVWEDLHNNMQGDTFPTCSITDL